MDPLGPIKDKLEEIKHDVRIAVEVAILEETTRFNLSRLMTLKPDRAVQYQASLDALK